MVVVVVGYWRPVENKAVGEECHEDQTEEVMMMVVLKKTEVLSEEGQGLKRSGLFLAGVQT